MKQPLDPEGRRRGWQSCLCPLEYQQTPSAGTERYCQRKALRLPGSQHFKDMPPRGNWRGEIEGWKTRQHQTSDFDSFAYKTHLKFVFTSEAATPEKLVFLWNA